jgi:ATP synthase protein I
MAEEAKAADNAGGDEGTAGSARSTRAESADGAAVFAESIGRSATRRIVAKEEAKNPVWQGLGLMGMVGWSVAVPTLIGVFVGRWMDSRAGGDEGRSWTLVMLAAGVAVGCFNAWRWVAKENAYNKDIREKFHRSVRRVTRRFVRDDTKGPK